MWHENNEYTPTIYTCEVCGTEDESSGERGAMQVGEDADGEFHAICPNCLERFNPWIERD